MSNQQPIRSEGVKNPENATGVNKYFLRSRGHGDEESLHDESHTLSPSPPQDSRDNCILVMEEKIRQPQATNARYHRQLVNKRPMQEIPQGEPKNLVDEGHDCDPDYEGLEILADIETSLTKDGKPPVEIESDSSNPPPRSKVILVTSQEESSRCSSHD